MLSLLFLGLTTFIQAQDYVTAWQTTTGKETVLIPCEYPSTLNVTWGDGTKQTFDKNQPISHIYDAPNLYTVTITGVLFGRSFPKAYAAKLTVISSWGSFSVDANSTNMFTGCTNLVKLPIKDSQPSFLPGATLEGMFASSGVTGALSWRLGNVVSLKNMFASAPNFNQPLAFLETQNIKTTEYMFARTKSYNQAVIFDTSGIGYMGHMFEGATAFNQAINFDASNLINADSMLENAVAFNSNFTLVKASSLISVESMFAGCTAFNQYVNIESSTIGSMASMFKNAARFNQRLDSLKTPKVTTMASMFANASSFNQIVDKFDTTHVTSMSAMFYGATSFNRTVGFATDNVDDMSYMFAGASSFNQFISFNASNVLDMRSMFADARSFNQPVPLDTRQVQRMDSMFLRASSFNQRVDFDTSNLTLADFMFAGAASFNQPVRFETAKIMSMVGMFENATSFNQAISFSDTRRVANMARMFTNAVRFDQKVAFSTDSVANMSFMFDGAASFNQPILFQADQLTSTAYMFRGAIRFNQAVELANSGNLISMASMFLNATSFNQTVNATTSGVTDMSFMFWDVPNYQQNLGNWNAAAVTNCARFCFRCGLPKFPQCAPCGTAPMLKSVSMRTFVCNCPLAEPQTTATTCGCDPTQVVTVLQVECANTPTPAPTFHGSEIASPVYNITRNDTNGTDFVFTLPLNEAIVERGIVSRPCFGSQLSCEWLNEDTFEFHRSGCAVSESMVDMGSGVVGTQCTCTHLTVFAIVLRTDLKMAPLCQAQEVDYVLIALYAALAVYLSMQVGRLLYYRLARVSTMQHSVLLIVCVLRVVYLVAKPMITEVAGLVLLGLLPSAIALSLFIHLLLAWASLQFRSLAASPFARFRVPFVTVVVLVFLLVFAMAVAVAASPSLDSQLEIVTDGSYLLAALYAVVCLLVLVAGLGLRRTLGKSSDRSTAQWRNAFRSRILIATIGLSACLFLVACLWVAAVQADILVSSAATLATTTSFYVFDWLSLCVMTWLLAKAVRDGVKKSEARLKDLDSSGSNLDLVSTNGSARG